MDFEENETHCFIRLDGEITIAVAAQLKDVLLQSIASGKEMRLNLERATRLDASIYQLLWAAERATHQSGRKICLDGTIPEAVLKTFKYAFAAKFPLL